MKTEPYELPVSTDEMAPRHKIGDTLYVDPNAKAPTPMR
jgi:hypothetical protein